MVLPADDSAARGPESAPARGEGPYRNLWVPLVVVPFGVVGVIVLVFVFFGAIGGSEATMRENLERVVNGGSNQRKQAAVSLAAQVSENRKAELEGREAVWDTGPDFLGDVLRAWEALPADDNPSIRLALAQLAAHYGDPGALEKLAGFLALSDDDDPQGTLRVETMLALSWTGDERVAGLLAPFLHDDDAYLRQSAAAALQNVPGEKSREALRGLLDDPSLELRGQAAISLSHLGDASGAEVLRELVDPKSYERVRALDPDKFKSERYVHQARLKAVEGLARLGRPEDRPLLEGLAQGEVDPTVREAAMLALEGKGASRVGRDAGGGAGGADDPR